jgi:hypothetical protein
MITTKQPQTRTQIQIQGGQAVKKGKAFDEEEQEEGGGGRGGEGGGGFMAIEWGRACVRYRIKRTMVPYARSTTVVAVLCGRFWDDARVSLLSVRVV